MNSEFVESSSAGKRVRELEGRKMGRLGRGEAESPGFGLEKIGEEADAGRILAG